jgi:hypothetical protein
MFGFNNRKKKQQKIDEKVNAFNSGQNDNKVSSSLKENIDMMKQLF